MDDAGERAGADRRRPFWGTRMDGRRWALAAALIGLSFIPLFIVTLAPLADWPIHIAIAQELVWLAQGHTNPYYHLDFAYLGYASLHLLMGGLMWGVGWELAAKLTLVLLFLLGPACWWAFFRILDPGKEPWFLIGAVLNYSAFFYLGAIQYLFAVHLGAVWLALGIDALRNGRERPAAFLAMGALTFISHGYTFILLGALLGALAAWRWKEAGRLRMGPTLLLLAAMAAAALASTAANPTMPRDTGYLAQVRACAAGLEAGTPEPFDARGTFALVALTTLDKAVEPLFVLFPAFWLVALPAALVALGKAVADRLPGRDKGAREMGGRMAQVAGASLRRGMTGAASGLGRGGAAGGAGISIDPVYAGGCALLLIYFICVPPCVNTLYCDLNTRGLPFALGLAALAVRAEGVEEAGWRILLVVFAVNILFQGYIFANEAPAQRGVLESVRNMAEGLPAGATLFVAPAHWNTIDKTLQYLPPFTWVHYHAMVVAYRPDIYASGLFMDLESYVVRSRMPIYDEMVNFGPYQHIATGTRYIDIQACYAHPPAAYAWAVGPDEVVRPNPANGSQAGG